MLPSLPSEGATSDPPSVEGSLDIAPLPGLSLGAWQTALAVTSYAGACHFSFWQGERSPAITLWAMPKKKIGAGAGIHDAEKKAAGLRQQQQSTPEESEV